MKTFAYACVALAVSVISACGGGGGGGNSGPSAPANLTYSDPVGVYLLAVEAPPNHPSVTGTVDSFAVAPPLPAGLALDPATGVIAGAPQALSAPSSHTITATNTLGSTTFDFWVEVVRPQRFAYVVHRDDSTISILDIDVASGRLAHKGYVTGNALEAGPERLVMHPTGAFAYATNLDTRNVSVFAVEAESGWLDRRTPAACGAGPHQIAITPNGAFAYVSNQGSDELFAFAVDLGNGELTEVGAPIVTGLEPAALAIDRDGKFLFVATRGPAPGSAGSVIDVFAIDGGNGTLTATGVSLAVPTTRVISLALDPQRNVLHAIGSTSDRVLSLGFDPATAALSVLSSLAAGSVPTSLGVHPTGRFNYVSSTDADRVSVFRIDAQGTTFGSPAASPVAGDPVCVTIDPAGAFVYVARRDQDEIVQYEIDGPTGGLTEIGRLRTRNQPEHITILQGLTPTTHVPKFVHVTNRDSQDVSTFTIDPTTGALASAGFAPLTGASPSSIAMDPRQRFAYVANEGASNVYSYFVDGITGILIDAAVAGTHVAGGPSHLVVDPSGRFLYVVTKDVNVANDGWMATFTIDPVDASLSQVDFRETGLRPRWVTIDPTGQFLYVSNTSAGGGSTTALVRTFKIDVETGIPTMSAADLPARGLRSLTFHPNGRTAYVALRNSNSIWQVDVAIDTGALSFLPGSVSGGQPVTVAVAPNGRWLYAAFEDSAGPGHVEFFALSPTGQMIEPGIEIEDGLHPIDIAIDPSGRFVYAANRGSNDVSVLRVNQATGELTVEPAAFAGLNPSSILVSGKTQ